MFCASATQSERRSLYRIDYSVPSTSAPTRLPPGTKIPTNSVVYSCTAIGQTNHGLDGWIYRDPLPIECVGIPAFVGASYPRVAGIIRFRSQDAQLNRIRFLHGDVLKPPVSGRKIICQLVNDRARVWGGGVARTTAKRYPTAQDDFSRWILNIPSSDRLGQVHFFDVGNNTVIASLIAQHGVGPSSAPRIRYAPLEKCFHEVAKFAANEGASVHLPRIGSGQSAGSWDTIEEIIRETLVASCVLVTVYDLPPKRPTVGAELLI